MTPLFRTRQRAEELSARLDGSAVQSGMSSAETERLVAVVDALRARGAADASAAPRDVFVSDLRERLLAEAATVLAGEDAGPTVPAQTRSRRERRLVAVTTAAVVLGGTAGVAAAAQSALPGDALYPIKRGIERVEVGLSASPAARGHDLLRQAAGRLDEVEALLAEGSGTGAAQIPGTLEEFTKESRQGAALLLDSYRDTGDAKSVVTVRRFAAHGLGMLAQVNDTAPSDARSSIRGAARALQDIDQRASALCSTCSDLPDLRLPSTFLVSANVDGALAGVNDAKLDNHRAVVRDEPVPTARRHAAGGTRGSGSKPSDVRARASTRAAATGHVRAERAPVAAPRPADGTALVRNKPLPAPQRRVDASSPAEPTAAQVTAKVTAKVTARVNAEVTGDVTGDVTARKAAVTQEVVKKAPVKQEVVKKAPIKVDVSGQDPVAGVGATAADGTGTVLPRPSTRPSPLP